MNLEERYRKSLNFFELKSVSSSSGWSSVFLERGTLGLDYLQVGVLLAVVVLFAAVLLGLQQVDHFLLFLVLWGCGFAVE
jgi:hypothetical protein